MKKRILAILLAALMLLLCSCDMLGQKDDESDASEAESSEVAGGSSDAESNDDSSDVSDGDESGDKESTVTPLFWKATDAEGNVLWLFGSIHAGYDGYYPLPDKVLEAYNGSDALAVEADIIAFEKDLEAAYKAMMPLIYTDGTKISDHISAELYDRAVAAMKDTGMYMSMYDMYKPAVWMSLIESACIEGAGLDTEKGIDRFFLKDAKKNDKKIVEIESAAEQYEMLGGFSDELQELLLEDAVTSHEDKSDVEGLKELADAWGKGDEATLNEMVLLPEDEEIDALTQEYWKAMMTDRNNGMVEYCKDAIGSGDEVFVVVGLAHFLGEDGIVNQLREAGYTVEEID
ncbi:MAG: TraB/GumN family protein [Clostridia bacterium]|nr:TraB/GumN family protein [Clostridia bacterium]